MQQNIRALFTIFAIIVVAHSVFGSDQVLSSKDDQELSQKIEQFRELKTLLAKLDQETDESNQDLDGVNTLKNLEDDQEANTKQIVYDENAAEEISKKLEEKRSGAYLRFGRSNPYLRFGRSNSAYLRFGKRLPVSGQNGGSSPVFLRFGKRNPAYLRFGK